MLKAWRKAGTYQPPLPPPPPRVKRIRLTRACGMTIVTVFVDY